MKQKIIRVESLINYNIYLTDFIPPFLELRLKTRREKKGRLISLPYENETKLK
jgi:hypothetical protein